MSLRCQVCCKENANQDVLSLCTAKFSELTINEMYGNLQGEFLFRALDWKVKHRSFIF